MNTNPIFVQQLAFSTATILVINLLFHLLKRYARRTQQKFGIRTSRYFAIRRCLSMLSLIVIIVALTLIWNLNLKTVWVSITGILAMIAIAFFAIWSLIGNITAGFIIYFTSPFKIDDTIEVIPDEVRGTVVAINTFYTVLMDEDKNYINIPNSMFFQKYIRVIKTKQSWSNSQHQEKPDQ